MFGRRLINTGGEAVIPYFNTVTYNGNGSTQSISGVGFQPDFVWIKSRSAATSHKLTDIVRGTTKGLVSNTTAAETTDTNGLTAFGSDGFTLGTDSVYNNSGATYVAWCWKAGGAAVTNTDGSITSDVSANVDAGFSVVKWTGAGANGTVGHGLNSAPDIYILKIINGVGSSTVHYNGSLVGDTGTKYLVLNSEDAESVAGQPSTTSVALSVLSTYAGGSGQNWLAYCFAEKAGFSKFGSYSAGGSSTVSVTTGFESAFIMFKRTDSTGNWIIFDNKRSTSGTDFDNFLYPNLSDAEVPNIDAVTVNSTGFVVTRSNAAPNFSGGTYIYMAFANQF